MGPVHAVVVDHPLHPLLVLGTWPRLGCWLVQESLQAGCWRWWMQCQLLLCWRLVLTGPRWWQVVHDLVHMMGSGLVDILHLVRVIHNLLQRGRCRGWVMVGKLLQRWGRSRGMIDNLLLADVSDLLGALLLEGLLLHGLVAVLAPDTSMTTLLTYDQLYNVQNKSIFIFLMSCSMLVSYFLLYRGLHFFSGISVLVGLHFWSICNVTREC